MAEQPDILSILADPLSPISRNERRNLLAASFVASLLSITHAYPKSITSLGINIETVDQDYFIWASIVVVSYFLVAFSLYSLADYMRVRALRYEYDKAVHREIENWTYEEQVHLDEIQEVIGNVNWVYRHSDRFLSLRFVFEFIFPLLCGVVAIAMAATGLRDT